VGVFLWLVRENPIGENETYVEENGYVWRSMGVQPTLKYRENLEGTLVIRIG